MIRESFERDIPRSHAQAFVSETFVELAQKEFAKSLKTKIGNVLTPELHNIINESLSVAIYTASSTSIEINAADRGIPLVDENEVEERANKDEYARPDLLPLPAEEEQDEVAAFDANNEIWGILDCL